MKKYLLFGLFLTLNSCVTKPYIPLEKNIEVVVVEPISNILQGKSLYESECSCCHRLYPPSKYTHLEWNYNLNQMQKEAEITDGEKALVYEYLVSESKSN